MNIRLSDHFTYKKLLQFTLPSISMMIFTSIYGIVDGFFVSNFAGKIPFAAVNLIMPLIMILSTVGFMLGAGGSALVSKTMGEGDYKKANRLFSLLIYVAFVVGAVLCAGGIVFIRPIAALLGADGALLDNCVLYARYILATLPFYILQMAFQSFFVTAEKPNLGLVMTVIAGGCNMVLDALFVAVFRWGLTGAAVATAFSQFLGGFVPFFYFIRPNDSLLRLTKTHYDGKALLKACTNGSSELMSNISMSVVSILYNMQLMKYAGEDGVAAYGVLMYVGFIFCAAFFGYSIGTAPVVGYHFGAQNHSELKNLLKRSLVIVGAFSIGMTIFALVLAKPMSIVFVGYDATLCELTINGFRIYAFAFLFMGYAIYSSGFFTALNDGLTSALISFLRTLVFQIAAVIILPLIFEINGIWYSIVVAEMLAVILSAFFIMIKRKKYHYL